MKVNVPPIKSQGIKTKLVPWVRSIVPPGFRGTWIEPFMGTGAVAFNLAPTNAILCDTNPHLINFYSSLACGEITSEIVPRLFGGRRRKPSQKRRGALLRIARSIQQAS